MASQNIKYIVFIFLLFLLFSLAVLTVSNIDVLVANGLWFVLALLFLVIVWKGDVLLMLEEYRRAVIMRFGKVKRVGGPGWCIVIPFIETATIVDLRTQTIDVPKQQVITKGKIELGIDAVIYLSVKKDKDSVIKSVIEVEDYRQAAKLYVVAALRDVLGSMTLDDVISNIETVNKKIKEGLEKISTSWGIDCESVEIKDVDIPKTVQDAIHYEKAAEQEKLARMQKAKAHEYEIETVKRAAELLSDKAMSYYYIRALEKLGEGKSTKFLFPMEITRLAESIAGGTKSGPALEDMFKKYAPAVKSLLSPKEKLQAKKKARKPKRKK
jgi:regulator of protease activity HflC (stomatin/prohibitin superfamily)